MVRIDGDGCPDIKKMEALVKSYREKMVVYVDYAHQIALEYASVVMADIGTQSVDVKLANEICKGDIVVTQDYGVAEIARLKGAQVVSPSGVLYQDETLPILQMEKHLHRKMRKQKRHIKGMKKRTEEDTNRLLSVLEWCLKEGERHETK